MGKKNAKLAYLKQNSSSSRKTSAYVQMQLATCLSRSEASGLRPCSIAQLSNQKEIALLAAALLLRQGYEVLCIRDSLAAVNLGCETAMRLSFFHWLNYL
jgi:hypothetical protein